MMDYVGAVIAAVYFALDHYWLRWIGASFTMAVLSFPVFKLWRLIP